MSDLEDAAALATRELLQELSELRGAQCFLLIDTSVYPVETADAPVLRYANRPHCIVPLAHRNIDPSYYPVLIPFLPDRAADAALLVHSVREACAELNQRRLQSGGGRRIGGWLVSHAPIEEVALHLGRIMIQRHPSGSEVWLRVQDPAVRWACTHLLRPAQSAVLLGPARQFYILDPVGELFRMQPGEPVLDGELDLSAEQWIAFDSIEPLNTALRHWGQLRRHEQLGPALEAAYWAIRRAKQFGFDDPRDLSFYGHCALAVHARFDSHPLLLARLRARRHGDFFGGLVADLRDEDWRQIAQEAPSLKGE